MRFIKKNQIPKKMNIGINQENKLARVPEKSQALFFTFF